MFALLQNEEKPRIDFEVFTQQIALELEARSSARIEAVKTAARQKAGSLFTAELRSEQSLPTTESPSSGPFGGWLIFSEKNGVTVLFVVWLAGFVMMGFFTGLRHVLFQKQLLREKREPSTEMRQLLEKLCLKMGLKFQGDVLVSDRIQGPAVIGWLHPKLVLPLQFLNTGHIF